MATQSPSRRYGQLYRLAVIGLLLIVLAIAGGASRYDEDQQMIARLAAIIALAATMWPLDLAAVRREKPLLLMLGCGWLLVLLQLIPLPPALWAALPGHDVYARIAELSGTVHWRPLSLTPDLTINALTGLLPATAAAAAALYLDGRSRIRLGWGVLAIAAASAILGLVQLAVGGDALHFYRESSQNAPVGPFANRNHQAVLMACALPLLGALVALRLRGGARFGPTVGLAAVTAALMLFALVSTGSRMGLVLAVIGIAGALLCWRAAGCRIMPRTLRHRAIAAASVIVTGSLIVLAAWRSGAVDRLVHTDATETRATIFAPLIETARAFMPFGAGFGSFDSVYRRFEPDALLSAIYLNQAHNEPLQLAIEGGVPALVLLAAFLWWWQRTACGVMVARESVTRRTFGIAAIVITTILMASSLVDYPLRTPLLGSLFAFASVSMLRAARNGRP